jgi:hypothetical protein
MVTYSHISPALSKAKPAGVTDPNGIRLEFNEPIPGSVLKQVEDS